MLVELIAAMSEPVRPQLDSTLVMQRRRRAHPPSTSKVIEPGTSSSGQVTPFLLRETDLVAAAVEDYGTAAAGAGVDDK